MGRKNKMGRDNVSITMTYVPGEGFSHILDYLSAAQDLGIVTKGGAWFQFGDRKFQGLGQLYYGMREDSGLFTALMDEVNVRREQTGTTVELRRTLRPESDAR